MGEVFAPRLRPYASGLATCVNCFTSFATTSTFKPLEVRYGLHFLFWIYAALTLAGAVLIWLFVPETKGKSLQEIQDTFGKANNRAMTWLI